MTRTSKLIAVIVIAVTAPLVMAQLDQAVVGDSVEQARNSLVSGQLQEALSRYQSLASEHPGSAEIMEGLGSALLLNQRYKDAISTYQKAVSLGETSGRSFMGMGMAYIHLGMFTKAEASLQEARGRRTAPSDDLDRLLNWLEQKQGTMPDMKAIH